MANTPEIEILRDIEYANRGGLSLTGDLYRPAGAKNCPVVIAVHGGGWQTGTPKNYGHRGDLLVRNGFALFAITYRLSRPGKPGFPDAPKDVRAAIQYVRHNAAALCVDPDRIALSGGSAGGHLAALVGLAAATPLLAEPESTAPYAHVSAAVKAVISFYGVYDMAAQWDHDLVDRAGDNITEKFLGAPLSENRRLYQDASPLTYAIKAHNAVSFLLIHGTEDDIVDRSQTDVFLRALKQAGFFARKLIVQGAGHFFETDPLDEPNSRSLEVSGPMLRFLRDRLVA
jgi:acetyl esterase/lipase